MTKSTDSAVLLLLTERNLDLERTVRELRREIDQKDKTIDDLKSALKRPSISVFTDNQLQNLAFLLTSMISEMIGEPTEEKKFVN